MDDLRRQVQSLKSNNTQLMDRLQSLRDQFQHSYHKNVGDARARAGTDRIARERIGSNGWARNDRRIGSAPREMIRDEDGQGDGDRRRGAGRAGAGHALGRDRRQSRLRGRVAAVAWSRSSSSSSVGCRSRPRSPGPRRPARPWSSGRPARPIADAWSPSAGDGTVSALINERPGSPLTVMPAGTENLVARHFGLRRDPHALARTIAAGRAVAGGRRPGRRPPVPPHGRLRLRRRRRHPPPSRADLRLGPDPAHQPDGLRPARPPRQLLLSLPDDLGPDRRPRRRGDAARHDGVHLQPAPIRPGAAVRPRRPRGRRLARPGDLPPSRPVPGVLLSLQGLLRHPSR